MQENIDRGIAIRNEILKAIVSYIQEHGYSPSVREIGEMVGLKSSSTIHHHLYVLSSEGKIETDCDAGVPRAIRVPGYKFVKQDVAEKKMWVSASVTFGEIEDWKIVLIDEEEALKHLESIVYEELTPYTQKAVLMAMKALEKQITKPLEKKKNPNFSHLGKMHYCCCGVAYLGKGSNYCSNCGQRLK